MKIQYTLTRSDLLCANVHLVVRNRLIWTMWSLLAIFVSYSWLTDGKYDDKTTEYRITMIVILAIVYFVVLFGLATLVTAFTVLIRKHVGVLGEHTLTIEEDGLMEEAEHNTSRSKWSLYHKTRIWGAFAFLYITEAQFHIIPVRRPLIEGNVQDFLEALEKMRK